MKFLITAVFLIVPLTVNAVDAYYSSEITRISVSSKLNNSNLPIPYLSRLSVEKNPATITNASGLSVMSAVSTVYSGYDSAISYDVSSFYRMERPRLQSALTIPSSSPGEYYTIGLDTGVSTQKLNVGTGLFLAYTNTLNLTKDILFNYSFGSWFGGRITESPCYDSYDRAYSCKSLTAWSDYQPKYPTQYSYVSIKAVKFF